ncbi:MAG: COX15/CtaA family protein [Saprospiraceae bacterium]
MYTALYYCYAYVAGWFDNPKYKLQRRSILILLGLVFVQLFLGGIISGMKAAVIFPTWPLIGNEFFPHILFSSESWKVENFINYDQNVFMPSLVHFLHRMTAYIIFVYVIWFILKVYNKGNYPLKRDLSLLFFMLISQIFIGIIMLINSKGEVPVSLGVLHQLVAVLFLTSILTLLFKSRYQQKI